MSLTLSSRRWLCLLPLTLACRPAKDDTSDTAHQHDTDSGADTETETDTDMEPVGVTLRRTGHGVVHVTAADPWGLGYGVGYAFTEDNACLLAYRLAEVDGRLAASLGANADVYIPVHGLTWTALNSDRVWRSVLDDAALAAQMDAGSAEARDLADGYAEGISRWLAVHGDGLDCAVPFPAEVDRRAVVRMWTATAMVASGELLGPFLADSAPRSATSARARAPRREPGVLRAFPERFAGSNAWAFGRDVTTDGGGVHLYNPHFPWTGIHRVYLVHLTIPGELDVFGPALGGLPVPVAGFTEHISWGLTFSNAGRFTVAELALVDGDPLSYTVDGETRHITEELVPVEVAGEDTPREVSFFRSEDGPVLDTPPFQMGWDSEHAYAVHDVNVDNPRMVEQFFAVARAADVAGVRDALAEVQGVPWSYVTATDAAGGVFFGDVSNLPDVTTAMLEDCSTSPTAQAVRAYGIYMLDGSRGECAWTGRLPVEAQPWTERSDWVANSNNSHDLPNLAEPLLGFSEIFGVEQAPLALRPIAGLRMIAAHLDGADGLASSTFDAGAAETIFLGERNLAGELLAAEIAADCLADPVGTWDGQAVDLTEVCRALEDWDATVGVESAGAHVFAGLWAGLGTRNQSRLWATAADWADPLHTPAGYSTDAGLREDVKEQLARVSVTLDALGVAPDARWGDVHTVLGPSGALPMPGGQGSQGVFDVIEGADGYGTFEGWKGMFAGTPPEALFGASYLHVVELGPEGVHARGVLPYSQATEADSPWYLDQLGAWSAGEWFDFPFTEAEIGADPELVVMEL